MIITYYGEGKGKTTAALGLALRASGYDKKILFAQFIKSDDFITGEDLAVKKIKHLTHKKFGLGFIKIKGDKHKIEDHRTKAQEGLKYINKHFKKFDIIIADELLGAIKGELIEKKAVIDLIHSISAKQVLVLTGRPSYKEIIDLSDLVTRMKEVKHPFKSGKMAVKSIDF